jgi:hypothetical protein
VDPVVMGSAIVAVASIVGIVLLVGLVALALVWRPPRGRRRNVEEALEDDALRREQDANITNAAYMADRLNIPGRGRR